MPPASAVTDPLGPLTGCIFMCNSTTFPECIARMLLATTYPVGQEFLHRIVPGYTQLFLYNLDERSLYGVFEAVEKGEAAGVCSCRWGAALTHAHCCCCCCCCCVGTPAAGRQNIEPYAFTVPWVEHNGVFPTVPPGTSRTRFSAQVRDL